MDFKFEDLVGKTLKDVNAQNDRIDFVTADDETYSQYHDQDCCESVTVEDIVGDLNDLIGSPILVATETSQSSEYNESSTWTFYNIATTKGHVTIRWYGNSNGYYSEAVSFKKTSQVD